MKTPSLRLAAALTAAIATAFAPALAQADTKYEHRKLVPGLLVTGSPAGNTTPTEPTSPPAAAPTFDLSTLSVDFGSVATNTSETRQVVVSNNGTGSLSITAAPSVTGGAEFAAGLTSCGATLAAGSDCLAEATFSPTTTGTFNGVMTFTAAIAGSPKEVTLIGTAFNPVSLASATLPAGSVGQPYSYDFKTLLAISNETSPDKSLATWSGSGTLPAGLTLDEGTGVLSGTPSAETAGATYTVLGTYKNNQGQQVYTIVVNGVTLSVLQVAAGTYHSCALTSSGGVKCWGNGFAGRLGNGGTTNSSVPVDVTGLTSGVTSISVGASHTCALTSAGGVKCWGLGSLGRLGNGDTTNQVVPVDVTGLDSGVAQISAGMEHTCAVTVAGALKCWGEGDSGRLGTGTTADATTPVDATALSVGVAQVAASALHTCVLTVDGGVKCWGYRLFGRIGNGGSTSLTSTQLTPVDVTGLTSNVARLSSKGATTCAITNSGGLKCWGLGTNGELGHGVNASSSTPVDVTSLGAGVSSVSVGNTSACAVTSNGGVKCWGQNSNGQLGDGTTTYKNVPTDVPGLVSGATSVAVGTSHACAATSDGVKCWGLNSAGQLGNGSTSNSTTPVAVQLAP